MKMLRIEMKEKHVFKNASRYGKKNEKKKESILKMNNHNFAYEPKGGWK